MATVVLLSSFPEVKLSLRWQDISLEKAGLRGEQGSPQRCLYLCSHDVNATLSIQNEAETWRRHELNHWMCSKTSWLIKEYVCRGTVNTALWSNWDSHNFFSLIWGLLDCFSLPLSRKNTAGRTGEDCGRELAGWPAILAMCPLLRVGASSLSCCCLSGSAVY